MPSMRLEGAQLPALPPWRHRSRIDCGDREMWFAFGPLVSSPRVGRGFEVYAYYQRSTLDNASGSDNVMPAKRHD